jgi:hypothetical protein
MADEAAEFWSAFEKETGEKVEARSIGEWYKGNNSQAGVWGLLVLTDKSFRFRHMPSDNWLLSIFKRADRSSESKQPIDLVIPRDDIVAVKAPKGGFLARLTGPAFPRFSVKRRAEEGETLFSFSADPSSGLLAALIKAAPATEATDGGK